MLTIYCRNKLETLTEKKRLNVSQKMRTASISACAASDDSDAGHKLELIHSSSCEDDRKLWKIEENTNCLIKSLMFV